MLSINWAISRHTHKIAIIFEMLFCNGLNLNYTNINVIGKFERNLTVEECYLEMKINKGITFSSTFPLKPHYKDRLLLLFLAVVPKIKKIKSKKKHTRNFRAQSEDGEGKKFLNLQAYFSCSFIWYLFFLFASLKFYRFFFLCCFVKKKFVTSQDILTTKRLKDVCSIPFRLTLAVVSARIDLNWEELSGSICEIHFTYHHILFRCMFQENKQINDNSSRKQQAKYIKKKLIWPVSEAIRATAILL